MGPIYLDQQTARNATADLWQQDQMRRLNDQYAPPPAPAPTAPPEDGSSAPPATPAQPSTPPIPAQPSTPPTAPSTAATGVTPTSPATASFAAPQPVDAQGARETLADHWTRNAIADLWQSAAMNEVRRGLGWADQGVQSALSGIPQEARGLASTPTTVPGTQAPPPSETAPGGVSGIQAPQPAQGQIATIAGGQSPTSAAVQAATPTTAGLSGGGDLSGRIGDRGMQIMSSAADTANWLGPDGQKALQAVLLTEGGLAGARGDQGRSSGPLQFYEGGQLASFAQQMGLGIEQAKAYVEQNPEQAIQWAIGTSDRPGYLGAAIQAGIQRGLTGADLATFAQARGQVSVSPERAGQNWQALFGSGQTAIAQAPSGGQTAASVGQPTALNRPSQFALGLSDADSYAACGPAAAIAFARAFGRNPTTQEAMQLAQQSGWTQGGGMNGVVNEKKLMDALGVPTKLETGDVNWSKVTADAAAGNPVVVSTPGHYFTVDDVQQAADGTTLYHLGTSGTDLKGGSEWMSAADMQRRMGVANGALFADHPQAAGPSLTEQVAGVVRSVTAPVQQKAQDLLSAVSSLAQPVVPEGGGYGAVPAGGVNPLQNVFRGVQSPQTGNPVIDVLGTGASALGLGAQTVASGLREITPSSVIARSVAGQEQIAAENSPLYNQLADLMQQYRDAKDRGDSQGMDRLAEQIQPLQDQWNDQVASQVTNHEQLMAAAERNPNLPMYESTGGVLPSAASAGLAGGEAPIAARAAAEFLQPGTNLPAAIGGVVAPIRQAVSDLATSRQPAQVMIGVASGADVAQAAQQGAQSIMAPLKNAPPVVQSIVRDFAGQMEAAKGQGDYLAKKAAQVLGDSDSAAAAARFERTGQFVDNPAPAQQAFATEVQQFNQQTGSAGRAAGYIRGDVTAGGPGAPENYFPHAYESGPTITEPVGPQGKGGLSPKGSYSQSRVFGTLDEAMANGYQPVDSVGQPLGNYARAVQQSQAKYDLVDRLKTAVPDGVDVFNPGDRLQPGFVAGAAIDPQLTGYQFRQDIATPLQNILSRSDSSNAALQAVGTAKEVMLSLSPFHLMTELRQAYRANNPQDALPTIGKAVWNMWGPNWDRFVVDNHDLFQAAQQAGVTQLSQAISPDIEGRLTGVTGAVARGAFSGAFGGVGAYAETKREGGSDEDALINGLRAGAVTGALGATVARPLADALFQRVIPTLKVLTFGLKQAGGADPEAAATFVNQTFGGQNLNMIARSQGVQNALRVALLAPDWWEGWARQIGGAVSPGDIGTMSRGYWARTLAESALTLGALNYAFSGHTADQNALGHQFDLETTNLTHQFDPKTGEPLRTYVNVLGPLKDIFTLASAPWQPGGTLDTLGTLAGNKLGLLPATARALVQNQDFQGNPIIPAGTPEWQRPMRIAEDVLGNLAPVSTAQTMRENAQLGPGAAALTTMTGLRTMGQTPTQEQAATTRAAVANAETSLRSWLEQQPAYQQMTPRQQELEFQRRVGDLRASLNEWQRLGPSGELLANAGVTVPSTAHSTMNYSGRQLLLTPDEQQMHQQVFDQRLQQTLQGYVNSTKFQQLPPDQQQKALQPLVSAATNYADQRVIAAMPAADRKARLAAAPPSGQAKGVAPFIASSGGLASIVARQSAAEADAAHQRLLAQLASPPAQPQLAPTATGP